MANNDFGEVTIHQLKGELKSRNARLFGRKADLFERFVWAIICVCDNRAILSLTT